MLAGNVHPDPDYPLPLPLPHPPSPSQLEEYYLYRTETQMLEQHASSILSAVEQGAILVELGCGSATKTGILLREALGR